MECCIVKILAKEVAKLSDGLGDEHNTSKKFTLVCRKN